MSTSQNKIAELAKTRDSINRDKIGFVDLCYPQSVLLPINATGGSRWITAKDAAAFQEEKKFLLDAEVIDRFIRLLIHISYVYPRNSKEKINDLIVKTVAGKAYLFRYDLRAIEFCTLNGKTMAGESDSTEVKSEDNANNVVDENIEKGGDL